MKEITLDAEQRPLTTKGDVKMMRQKGRVPGVAYGDKESPVLLVRRVGLDSIPRLLLRPRRAASLPREREKIAELS